ncbi:MAG: hypothetical protein FWD33_03825 [Alphaproteobacteria bacterium]|nr:hypothetical protein [Alphaproteobacteria bacterium]
MATSVKYVCDTDPSLVVTVENCPREAVGARIVQIKFQIQGEVKWEDNPEVLGINPIFDAMKGGVCITCAARQKILREKLGNIK